jgi:hypothetical protein
MNAHPQYLSDESRPYYVYFLRSGDLVKVGCSSFPGDRLRSVDKNGVLLGCVRGDFRLEAKVHQKMRLLYGSCSKGKEWFAAPVAFHPSEVVDLPMLQPAYVMDIKQAHGPSRRTGMKRLTAWVEPARLRELKKDAKQKGLIFSFYLEKLLEDAWLRRNV